MSLAQLALTLAAAQAPEHGPTSGSERRLTVVESLQVELPLAAQRLADLDGDGKPEVLLIARDGRVQRRAATGEHLLGLAGELRIEDPARVLLDVSSFEAEKPGAQLLLATPKGLWLWALAEGGGFEAAPRELAGRARLPFRTGEPRLAGLAQDVNRDGRMDVVLPVLDACELWLNEGAGEGGLAKLRRTARVAVDVDSSVQYEGLYLSSVLVSSFSVPNLSTRDVDGDGRPDLLVEDGNKRSFFLQGENGSFPQEPSVEVDLSIFRDTGATGGVRPGQTLAVVGDATYESRDLDGDGIPDYLIAHGRKVWVFLGTRKGPQFTEPLTILKTAEDVTALTPARLDDDALPDLVIFKVQVPTVATLLRGLFGEWDVDIGAVGYKNQGGKGFESTPSFRSELVVRLPAIVKLLKDPGQFLERFQELRGRFRTVVRGDFDGDRSEDLGLISADGLRLDVWLEPPGVRGADLDADRALREVLFESHEEVWDLDRIMMWVGDLADRQVALRTGGRPAAASLDLTLDARLRLAAVEVADLDGDGRAELLVVKRPADGTGASVVDVVRLLE
jgi:FG-GAP-like repeat